MVDTVFLGTYPRKIFDRIGGFDEELVCNQYDEFNFRLIQAGGKIGLDPLVIHKEKMAMTPQELALDRAAEEGTTWQ